MNIKEWFLLELQITKARHPLSISDEKKLSKFNTPQNWKKKYMKRAQNRRCTSSICEPSLGKNLNEKEWELLELPFTQTWYP